MSVALACALLTVTTPRAAGKRFITERDLLKFTWIADPQISPDGSTVAFVCVTINEKENRYETSLYVVPTSGSEAPRRLTSGIRDTSPRWSPDGKRLAFVRSIDKDGKPQAGQIYLLPTDGGEARPLTETANGAGVPVWSPDGNTIAFTTPTGPEDSKKAQGRGTPEGPEGGAGLEPQKSDVKVMTRAVYRANGNPTYVEPDRHAHIWTIPVADTVSDEPQAKQITDGAFDERDIVWAPDGRSIYFVSDRVAESYYLPSDSDLYSVPAAGGAIANVASIDGTIGEVSPSPDGKRLAFIGTLHGNPVRSYSQPDLWVTDAAPGGTPKNLTAGYDFDMGGGIGGDQAAPRGQNRKPILWSRDGASLIVASAEHGSGNLKRVTIATGKVEPLTEGARDVVAYSAMPDASKIAATLSTQTNIGDIAILSVGPGLATPSPITGINEDL
ncbi:MAG: PD40 domain-containing protein, partial [Acidobacteria bacterium]|nr:PD40 domain-containing protein [Acidobacteriota bacterium]